MTNDTGKKRKGWQNDGEGLKLSQVSHKETFSKNQSTGYYLPSDVRTGGGVDLQKGDRLKTGRTTHARRCPDRMELKRSTSSMSTGKRGNS